MGLARSDLEEADMGLLGCGLTHGLWPGSVEEVGWRGAGPWRWRGGSPGAGTRSTQASRGAGCVRLLLLDAGAGEAGDGMKTGEWSGEGDAPPVDASERVGDV